MKIVTPCCIFNSHRESNQDRDEGGREDRMEGGREGGRE